MVLIKISDWTSRCHWDLENGKKTMEFNGHAGDIASISMSPDMNQYLTGSVDRTVKLWDVREDKHKQMFFGHEMDVNCVCVMENLIKYTFNSIIIHSDF